MALQVTSGWDKKELAAVRRGLKKLSPKNDKKLEATMRLALKGAAKPMVQGLKQKVATAYPTGSGQLERSIGAIPTKSGIAVYVGPRVKRAFKGKDKSGFYFYFLSQSGFTTGYSKKGEKRKEGPKYSPDNLLDGLEQFEPQVYSQISNKAADIIGRRCQRLGFNYG